MHRLKWDHVLWLTCENYKFDNNRPFESLVVGCGFFLFFILCECWREVSAPPSFRWLVKVTSQHNQQSILHIFLLPSCINCFDMCWDDKVKVNSERPRPQHCQIFYLHLICLLMTTWRPRHNPDALPGCVRTKELNESNHICYNVQFDLF